MRRALDGLVLLGLALTVAACAPNERKQPAESAVRVFHSDFNAGRYAEVYSGASSAFQLTGSQADFVAYLDAVHRKLGSFRDSEPGPWRVFFGLGGTFVDLSYQSRFDLGSGVESFVFVVSDGKAVLQAYNINSRELVVK